MKRRWLRYESEFKQYATKWAEILDRNAERMKRGSYSLHWMNTDKASWGRRAKPSSRGLTYTDINNVPGYGVIPEKATCLNFAARGSVRDEYAAEMPVVDDYTLVESRRVMGRQRRDAVRGSEGAPVERDPRHSMERTRAPARRSREGDLPALRPFSPRSNSSRATSRRSGCTRSRRTSWK